MFLGSSEEKLLTVWSSTRAVILRQTKRAAVPNRRQQAAGDMQRGAVEQGEEIVVFPKNILSVSRLWFRNAIVVLNRPLEIFFF